LIRKGFGVIFPPYQACLSADREGHREVAEARTDTPATPPPACNARRSIAGRYPPLGKGGEYKTKKRPDLPAQAGVTSGRFFK